MTGRIDAVDDDWTGGGYGRYPGLSMSEIRRRFNQCLTDPSPRSISAIFRIAHEQIEARGRLGLNLAAAKVCLALAVVSLGVAFAMNPESRTIPFEGAGIGAFGVLLFGIGAFRIRHAVRMNINQERQIRQEALAAIETLLNQDVDPRPLTREQRDLLREMLKKEKHAGKARDLLRDESSSS